MRSFNDDFVSADSQNPSNSCSNRQAEKGEHRDRPHQPNNETSDVPEAATSDVVGSSVLPLTETQQDDGQLKASNRFENELDDGSMSCEGQEDIEIPQYAPSNDDSEEYEEDLGQGPLCCDEHDDIELPDYATPDDDSEDYEDERGGHFDNPNTQTVQDDASEYEGDKALRVLLRK